MKCTAVVEKLECDICRSIVSLPYPTNVNVVKISHEDIWNFGKRNFQMREFGGHSA